MRTLFCGGGTGGHIAPALAIAEYIQKKEKSPEIAFVGRLGGDENSPIVKKGYKLYEIEICGITRKISPKLFKSIFTIMKSCSAAEKILRDFQPDVVVGTGGYVSWPVVKLAAKLKIPSVIHESNAYPGLVTRLLSKKASKVLLNFQEAEEHLKCHDKIKLVGMPVKDEFFNTNRKKARKELGISDRDFLIVSFGGSGGAEKMNLVMREFIEEYSQKQNNIVHIHASGKKYYSDLKDLSNKSRGVEIRNYIDNMPTLLSAADTVISRAGAATISELEASGAPAILIPSPNVTNNHQYKNAKGLESKKAAVMIEEKDFSSKRLIEEIDKLRKNGIEKKNMSKNISLLAKKDSCELFYKEIKEIFYSATK